MGQSQFGWVYESYPGATSYNIHFSCVCICFVLQVGVLSRIEGCGSSDKSPTAIYSKVGVRKAWIMAHIVDGGCSSYE